MGDYQSCVHPERWKEMEIRIRTKEPPRNNAQYKKMRYQSFKELENGTKISNILPRIIYTKNDKMYQCPTRGSKCNGASQLSKRRKNSPSSQAQYWENKIRKEMPEWGM